MEEAETRKVIFRNPSYPETYSVALYLQQSTCLSVLNVRITGSLGLIFSPTFLLVVCYSKLYLWWYRLQKHPQWGLGFGEAQTTVTMLRAMV